MRDIQFDTFSLAHSRFAHEVVNLNAASAETLKLLGGWDGKMNANSQAALLANEMRAVFRSKIFNGNGIKDKPGGDAGFLEWLITEKPKNWLPKEYKSYKDLLVASDTEARANLAKKYGANQSDWLYGNAFQIRFPHPLAAAPLIGGLFAIEAFPLNGNGLSPNVGASVSMRHITVPGNWDATRHGIALGESGDPKSPHWKDQLENWKSGETQIFPFSKAAVEKAATEVILLKP